MSPILSILIPSRNGSPEDLRKTLESCLAIGKNIDVLVRVDDDDPLLEERFGVCRGLAKVTVGLRLSGYVSGGEFIDALANMAEGKWIALCDDDCTYELDGEPVDEQLARLPTTGVYCQPEWYQLGQSVYVSDYGPPASIVPNLCWLALGQKRVCHPADDYLYSLLHDRGWKTHAIKGLTINHARKEKCAEPLISNG